MKLKPGFAVLKSRCFYAFLFVVFGSLLVSTSSLAFAGSMISLVVNGQSIQCSQPPQIIDGRVLVPLRNLDNALGAQTAWNGATQQVTVATAVYNVAMNIGSTTLTVNGQDQTMDTAPVIIGGKTFLPARYVAEALGYQVAWDAASQSVIITNSNSNTTGGTTMEQSNIQGMTVQDIAEGTGKAAANGDQVTVNYVGTLTDGTVFDSSIARNQPFSFTLGAGQVIQGWDLGVVGMKVGGERKLVIPPALGYGAAGAGSVIPPNSTLVFTVTLLAIN